ncbi:GmrSD restriction endonuclease domain-containing protein [[Kitasatospora] papulosa]|uniref:GmrSD restriction endonuclease domain-containing protein n=1 Tax=[Kitasatospora] papulosa TaxID=1464011 RepID=UPI0036A3D86E
MRVHDGADAQLVDGRGQTVSQLFKDVRYGLEYYQREYTWSRRNMQELLDDLANRFLDQWKSGHERADVRFYRPYFLGSIVTYESDRTYLVDGQQRFTSLLLLLSHLRGLLGADEDLEEDAAELDRLIRSRRYGQRSFTLDVPERDACMEALLKGRTDFVLPPNASLSVKNLWARGCDLAEDFPATLRGEPLPYFVDWLLHRVCLVDIRAHDRDNGWEIFETMNDRGARLTPLDLLKGFLLSHAGQNHAELNKAWRDMLSGLTNAGAHPSDFIKTLLQARYVQPDTPDLDKIDGSFHEWVREHAGLLELTRPDQFRWFITDVLVPSAERYSLIQRATIERVQGLETVRYNADNGLTAQLTLLTAAMRPEDDERTFIAKAQLVARFLDLMLARRIANSAPIQNVEVLPEIMRLVPSVREAATVDELSQLLGREAAQLGHDFSGINTFKLRSDNRKQVRYLLARMTAFVEGGNGNPDRTAEYLGLEAGARPHEIEHVWENHYDRHKEAGSEEQFRNQRDQLGALLLLPKSDNASYQDAVYERKIRFYRGQNLLAALLHPESHERNPRLRRFIESHDLVKLARPYGDSFPPSAIKERQRLYRRLCELLWNPADLGFTLPAGQTAKRTPSTRAHYGITPAQLIAIGLLKPHSRISTTGKTETQYAVLLDDGRVQLDNGAIYDSLSTAAQMALNIRSCNGWRRWQVETENGLEQLIKVRQRALERGLIA